MSDGTAELSSSQNLILFMGALLLVGMYHTHDYGSMISVAIVVVYAHQTIALAKRCIEKRTINMTTINVIKSESPK